ncbi:PQQ-dependent sugar dehydrogenase [Sphingomonas sp. M1-B02]|uniref:PQQ-dependent sugar dehydrogenase n=1 Tax=Sphingomonas sp. M1-B02 TaxID=3114300 RepID=UPI00223F5D00|nr:PQQ-dependent sugar dehydrogenase [Sphingomonas sp. S6-11]UZK65165.1 PQQ-dependent sugar dehydrogenase [Sphingomonas sp. S6-11]
MISAGRLAGAVALLALAACGGGGGGGGGSVVTPTPTPSPTPAPAPAPTPTPSPTATPITSVRSTTVATFASPWAMVFLPDGRALVTEKGGALRLVTQAGAVSAALGGVPAVAAGGQGGLLDVALHPDFATNRLVYLSFAESGTGGAGLAVARGTLAEDGSPRLSGTSVIWRQTPKVSGANHFGGRMAFGPTGHLFVTAGERQQGSPAQDLTKTLGKVVRLNADGSVPADNPFVATAGARPEIWSFGHRNPYGLFFDQVGRLWENEMGPEGGDEFNLIARGGNYGWPNASNGQDYGGGNIPDHAAGDGFVAPLAWWTPVIAPGGMILYSGTLFAPWQGDAILAGLVSGGLVRVRFSATSAAEVQRIGLGQRIREVEQGPDGAIWVLEDGAAGRLRRLVPN